MGDDERAVIEAITAGIVLHLRPILPPHVWDRAEVLARSFAEGLLELAEEVLADEEAETEAVLGVRK